ncbi:MAG: LptF/LptG family permease [Nitrospirae bacterium]|nr:LptF/LptG family permease [Nitrospirota bacterium]MBF0533890.1 LptF/LptG family permease [Nitrospirota bacterium]MBF0615401.1 LptF/LptG family permease [Nitrospirota bacterium]
MKILIRQYVKETVSVIFIVSLALSFLIAMFEVIDKLDKLVKFSPGFNDFALYWVYVLPRYLKYLLPMAVLMAVLIVFGQASKLGELVAVKASGGRLKRLFLPVIVLALLVSFVDFAVDELIAAKFNFYANNLLFKIKNKKQRLIYKTEDVWFMEKKDMIINAALYQPEDKSLNDVSVFVTNGGKLVEIIKSKRCYFKDNMWVMDDALKYDLRTMSASKVKDLHFENFKTTNIYDDSVMISDEMHFLDLYRYNLRLKAAGYNNQRVLVDLNAKLSYPFTCMVMVLLGLAISARFKMGGNIINVGLSIAISLIYWIFFAMAISLGYSGILPALLSAWLIPVSFGAVAAYFFNKIPE